MPLVIDGIEIPVEAMPDAASFAAAKKAIQELERAEAKLTDEQKKDAAINKKLIADIEAARLASIRKQEAAEKAAAAAAKKRQDEYRASLNKTREDAEKLAQIGSMMTLTGAAIVGPLILAAKKFADTASENDRVAQDWKRSMSSLEESSTRAGRVIASELNPALQTTARLVKQMADILDENPAIAGAALSVGGGLITIGGLISVIASIEKTIATLKLLTAAGGAAGAGTAGGAVLGGAQIAALAAAVLAVTNAEREAAIKTFGTKAGEIIAFIATAGISQAWQAIIKGAQGDLGFGIPSGNKSGGGSSTSVSGAIAPPSTRRRDFTDIDKVAQNNAAVNNFRKQFDADTAEAQKKIAEARKKILDAETDAYKAQAEIARKFAKQSKAILDDEARQNAQAYRNYQKSRAQAIQDTEREIEKIRADSQKRQRQLEKDHGKRTYELLAERDALGLIKENQDYDEKKAQEQESTREEIAQRRADLRTKLQDLAKAYREELQMNREEAQRKLDLLRQERDYEIELTRQKNAEIRQALLAAYDQLLAEIRSRLGSVPSGGSTGGGGGGRTPRAEPRAVGGYAYNGTYRLGERDGREFVINAANTRRLERQNGGPLTQQSLGGGMVVNINLTSGTITQTRQIINQTKAEIVREFAAALESA